MAVTCDTGILRQNEAAKTFGRRRDTVGWEIHITRAEHWANSERHPITANEWLAHVESDPDLMIDPCDNVPYFALWKAHRIDGDYAWFDWFAGAINTKHPDRLILGKAIEIARSLGARVQGDDGELYERPEDLSE
jgi:hypothetical protein